MCWGLFLKKGCSCQWFGAQVSLFFFLWWGGGHFFDWRATRGRYLKWKLMRLRDDRASKRKMLFKCNFLRWRPHKKIGRRFLKCIFLGLSPHTNISGGRFLECKLLGLRPHTNLGRRFLESKLMRFRPHRNLGRRFLEAKLMRFRPHRNLGRRFLESKLMRFRPHTKVKGNRFLECKLLRLRPHTNLGKQVSEIQIFEMVAPQKNRAKVPGIQISETGMAWIQEKNPQPNFQFFFGEDFFGWQKGPKSCKMQLCNFATFGFSYLF